MNCQGRRRRKNGALFVTGSDTNLLVPASVTLALFVTQLAGGDSVPVCANRKPSVDYRAAQRVGEPIDIGPVEAICRPGLCCFKRPGQFWSPVGDEALPCLATFRRNERWRLLFPHTAFRPSQT